MNMVTVDRDGVREIAEVAPALKAALGDDFLSMSLTPRNAVLHLKDGISATRIALAKTTYTSAAGAIDDKTPPPSVARQARQENAVTALRGEDFDARQSAIASANSVQALRAEVSELAKLVQRLLIAQGMNEQDASA